MTSTAPHSAVSNRARVIPLRPAKAPRINEPRIKEPRIKEPRIKEPLWRHVVGAVLRRERLAQQRTLKDVSEAAQISMPYLSELERGRKEASSEILAAAARALGLNLADLLARAHTELAEAELARTTPRSLTSTRTLSSGGPLADAGTEHSLTSLGDLGTRHTGASVVTEGVVNLAA